MTKRAAGAFERRASDFYPTPPEAVHPLIPHLKRTGVKTFVEPCYGDGSLIQHLEAKGFVCVDWGDLNDENHRDALSWKEEDYISIDAVITNPPWEKSAMHRIMQHQCVYRPSWFLIYSDWLFTKQSGHIMRNFCTDIVPIGRIKWIPGSESVGFDNCCWVCMNALKDHPTIFWPFPEAVR